MQSTMRILPSRETELTARYQQVRSRMLALIEGFGAEDLCAQSMPDASPAKWHLAHTSWFFEAMILASDADYRVYDPRFQTLFNSYYEALGERVARADRGKITRPSLSEALSYRHEVDRRMERRLTQPLSDHERYLVELGLNHEQQHQELLVQDMVHLFSCNPLSPSPWRDEPRTAPLSPAKGGRIAIDEGLYEIGHKGRDRFAFDNESGCHKVWLDRFEMAADLVTCGEWLSFIDDGGYQRPELWLADGWACVKENGWQAPLYWYKADGDWTLFGPEGLKPLRPDRPVRHVSYYEADAYARWANARLPSEAEWEVAAVQERGNSSNLDTEVWQWTASAYAPYPGFQPTEGTAAEYNGKFMANQYVLRGGSFATPSEHLRLSYRNFYYPFQRWAFTGLRLAFSAEAQA